MKKILKAHAIYSLNMQLNNLFLQTFMWKTFIRKW